MQTMLAVLLLFSIHKSELENYAPTNNYSIELYGLVSYDTGLRTPRWVLHQINEQSVTGTAERPGGFFSDESIDKRWRTKSHMFDKSGFDRGHCAPCADFKYSQEIMDACMSLKNIMPQASKLNRGQWARLEDSIRGLASDGALVTIVTGPAWKSEMTRSAKVINGMVAGTHTFKAILAQRGEKKECYAWLAPNTDDPGEFDSWRVSTDVLEEVIGFDLWNKVLTEEEQQTLEAVR